MKQSLVYATFVATFVCAAGLPRAAQAQAQQRPAAPPTVAVIDLKYIFDKHARFQAMRAELMKDVEQAEVTVKQKQDELRKMVEKLKDYHSGTPEFKQLETQIANMQADLKVEVTIQKKEFMEREAQIHYHIYQEVIDEVKYYCERNGVQLVLRFSGDPVDPLDPQNILAELNKSVVFFNPAADITPHILQSINARYEMRQPAAAAGVAPAQPGQLGQPGAPAAGVPPTVNPGPARVGVPRQPQPR